MSKSAFATLRHGQSGLLSKFDAGDRGDDQLGDPFAMFNSAGIPAVVDEQISEWPPVIAVDGSGRIENGETILQGQSAAWPNLSLETGWYGQGQASRNQDAIASGQIHCLGQTGPEIKARGPGRHLLRSRRP